MDNFTENLLKWQSNHLCVRINEIGNINASDFLISQTRQVIKSQAAMTDRLINNQNSISKDFKNSFSELIDTGNEINFSLKDIKNTLDWGFEEIIWNVELSSDYLKRILEILEAPLTTQAKELRKRAEIAYKNGWIDEAIEDFSLSEKKNIYDFAIHRSLSNIYLFYKNNPQKSLEYCNKTIKYALPYDKEIVGDTHLLMGFIYYLSNDFLNAIKSATVALEYSSNSGLCYFQRAQYYTKIGDYEKAVDNLRLAIDSNRNFAIKIRSENDFLVIEKEINNLFDDISRQNLQQISNDIDFAKKITNKMKSVGLQKSDYAIINDYLAAVSKQIENKNIASVWKAVDMDYEFYHKNLPNHLMELDGEWTYKKNKILSNQNNVISKIGKTFNIFLKIFFAAVAVFILNMDYRENTNPFSDPFVISILSSFIIAVLVAFRIIAPLLNKLVKILIESLNKHKIKEIDKIISALTDIRKYEI